VTNISSGSQVGPYRVEDLIGRGGMGEVYRAHDTRLQRHVALKVLAPRLRADSEHLARFAQEARTTALLNHPNIVMVYDVGSHDGIPFVVSELLEGETLRARIRRGPASVGHAIGYAHGIATGLVAAHRRRIVHRDLKPENVFVTRDQRVKILDFGLATCGGGTEPRGGTDESEVETAARLVVGTIGYAAPEQVRGGTGDHRSDLFSLGVILYELLTRAAPFGRESAIETAYATLKEDPRPLGAYDPQLPFELDRIVRRCLEKRPDARFQSASDLSFSLEPFLHSQQQPQPRRAPLGRLASIFGLF
jgi:serine/threonine protein kinase